MKFGLHRHEIEPQARFRHLLATAEAIAKINPRGLYDLVYAILRPYQSELMLAVAERGSDLEPGTETHADTFLGEWINGRLYTSDGMIRGLKLSSDPFRLQLGHCMVLPWPSCYTGFVDALAKYGTSKIDTKDPVSFQSGAPWTFISTNHMVALWLPWGIGFVGSGNHSISAGILASEGVIKPRTVYDMSYLLDEIHTDGITWRDSATMQNIATVTDHRIAAVFEIGRIMLRTGFPAFQQETSWFQPRPNEPKSTSNNR